jgi:hypothetical protein
MTVKGNESFLGGCTGRGLSSPAAGSVNGARCAPYINLNHKIIRGAGVLARRFGSGSRMTAATSRPIIIVFYRLRLMDATPARGAAPAGCQYQRNFSAVRGPPRVKFFPVARIRRMVGSAYPTFFFMGRWPAHKNMTSSWGGGYRPPCWCAGRIPHLHRLESLYRQFKELF